MACIICDEKFNKRNHSLVRCPYCDFDACRICCETYISDQPFPKCMNISCNKEWSRKFIVNSFTKTFIQGTWKRVREHILFQKEVALLPATQILMEQEQEQAKINKEHQQRVQQLIDNERAKMSECDAVIQTVREQKQIHQNEIHQLYQLYQVQPSVKSEPKMFIRACPENDCRGFLSSQWKCGLCESYTCSDCHAVKGKSRDEEHVCNPEDILTAKLLATDTKPCPSCASSIFKIEGCDQMWCTQCHTAFSWRTGHIETNVHNPHYYEWQRRNGGVPRAPGDIQCGRELNHRYIEEISQSCMDIESNAVFLTESRSIIQSTIHLRFNEMQKYRVDPVENNLTYRLQYLRNFIDKETFQTRLQRDNIMHEKKRETFQVLDLFVQATTDIMYRLLNEPDVEVKKTILTEVYPIKDYVNECLIEIAKTYLCKPKRIILFHEQTENARRRAILF